MPRAVGPFEVLQRHRMNVAVFFPLQSWIMPSTGDRSGAVVDTAPPIGSLVCSTRPDGPRGHDLCAPRHLVFDGLRSRVPSSRSGGARCSARMFSRCPPCSTPPQARPTRPCPATGLGRCVRTARADQGGCGSGGWRPSCPTHVCSSRVVIGWAPVLCRACWLLLHPLSSGPSRRVSGGRRVPHRELPRPRTCVVPGTRRSCRASCRPHAWKNCVG